MNNVVITDHIKQKILTSHSFLLSVKLDALRDLGILDIYLEKRGKKYEDFKDADYYDYITLLQAKILGII